jgi:23S rRNA (cytidine1920-2'-O)/16S rRNA (cytidine1409-2'-O)-methyltransferase
LSPTRRRLDLEIVRRGLAPSRERAQALILAGRVRVLAVERPKAGAQVTEETVIEVDGLDSWVSRGERLRQDPRVILSERTNARHLAPDSLPEKPTLATMDVSFISILKILPALAGLLAAGADVVSLVKPQFEASRADVGSGGIIRDEAVHTRVMLSVVKGAEDLGFSVQAVCRSQIDGASGNREFFLHALSPGRPGGDASPGLT